MPLFRKPHLIIKGRSKSYPYTPNPGRDPVIAREDVDRAKHAQKIRTQFNRAVRTFQSQADTDFVYLTIQSPVGFLLNLKALQDSKYNFQLRTLRGLTAKGSSEKAQVQKFKAVAGYGDHEDDDNDIYEDGDLTSDNPVPDDETIYEATVYLNKKAIATFLKKLDQYLNKESKTGKPRHQKLIANIEHIAAATLESFWNEPEQDFPSLNTNVWWEVWLSRSTDDPARPSADTILGDIFDEQNVRVGRRWLVFPESYVVLIKATARTLASTLLFTDRLMELRHPHDLADFFVDLPTREQREWAQDLADRVTHDPDGVAVCLLDTGVTLENPLLKHLIPQKNLDAIEPHWTKADTGKGNGHGTPMAGLALYGDLTELLSSTRSITIYHQLESVKILSPSSKHDPDNYGAITAEAVARGELMHPDAKRMVCMAITQYEYEHYGRPTSWSSAIDQIVFGSHEQPNTKTLFFICAGNLYEEEFTGYPYTNRDRSIHDPAQAFNAITVGAYTLKDQVDAARFPGAEPIAKRGALAASSSTSHKWDPWWAGKPDIVMEGGNHAVQNNNLIVPDSLRPLSTGRGGGNPWLHPFGDTSGATALASRFGAIVTQKYPNLWPETIRGLIIHSADWTKAMLEGKSLRNIGKTELKQLLKEVGYGVPNITQATTSASNSLSLIAERKIKPFKIDGSSIKTDKFHLFTLPWPKEALEELFATEVKLKVTLSYFIEPNPNSKSYQLATSYISHGLRFKMIDRNESTEAFAARVSKAMREKDYQPEGSEQWIIGNKIRSKGSIHKDIWIGTAADLAAKNKIAIYPVGGWWRYRKQLKRYEHSVRYSLIVTIETPDNNVDIYTPVANLIDITT
ncbi:hypothetical protein DCC81_03920 [Chitinophaga parva]|uniref:Peptidase S8/S53 domain-containing protein n=1 Tax=Chitinophaga parva TaxID=2169414 RepID=A0A2T7BLZ5_9BACT|nr:S8 family peptidase [Chitinophaga parva]PUZ28641.1 hypothetical protein DCC81_03920 [Chitinophaga parva]